MEFFFYFYWRSFLFFFFVENWAKCNRGTSPLTIYFMIIDTFQCQCIAVHCCLSHAACPNSTRCGEIVCFSLSRSLSLTFSSMCNSVIFDEPKRIRLFKKMYQNTKFPRRRSHKLLSIDGDQTKNTENFQFSKSFSIFSIYPHSSGQLQLNFKGHQILFGPKKLLKWMHILWCVFSVHIEK